MKIMIRGCNNNKCMYWCDGICDLPASHIDNWHGVILDTIHTFDYDFKGGKLICTMYKDID